VPCGGREKGKERIQSDEKREHTCTVNGEKRYTNFNEKKTVSSSSSVVATTRKKKD